MSAAEKLKALEPFHLTVESIGDVTLYALPLSQIVAVVEAAEICRSEWQMGAILATALDALDEALS